MFTRAKRLVRSSFGRPRAWVDYARASIEHPGLFRAALARVLQNRAAKREAIRRARGASKVEALADGATITPDLLIDMLAERMGVLVLDQRGNVAEIGISTENLLLALSLLQRLVPQGRSAADGRRLSPGSRRDARRALRAPQVVFTARPKGARPVTLSLEAYGTTLPGQRVSQNTNNLRARGLFTPCLDAPGRSEIRDLLGGPTIEDRARQEPVDVVYTWVNHDDPDWKKAYDAAKSTADPSRDDSKSADGDTLSRFHSNDELRYSLRSVEKNLPWVNKIYVFTNCAPPDWFDPDQDRLVWVRHEEVIPAEFLPTFNSHVIESYLHAIPGLSDAFLYQNDDVFIAKPLPRRFFFEPSGISHSFLEPYGIVSGPVTPGDADYRNAARNSAALIQRALGFVPTRLHRHTTFALRRSILTELEERFADTFRAMRANRFRDASDVNVTSFLYHHYAMGTGRAVAAEVSAVHVKNLDLRWRAVLRNTSRPEVQIYCINEGGAETPSRQWHRAVSEHLGERFPHPAAWERQAASGETISGSSSARIA